MATIEIDREDWRGFFEAFARKHEGNPVTVELLAGRLGDQIEIENMPLRGISVEHDGIDRLQISVADETGRHLTHAIDSPSHVWLKQAEGGAEEEEVLEIQSTDATTLVRLPSRVNAERRE